METAQQIVDELESLGNESTKRTLMRHGAREPFFGVKVADLKKIQKRVKSNHPLALELYATGNSDAMYLAGLLADDQQMTKRDLNRWAREAYWYMLSEYTVPGVAAGNRHGHELARKWIDDRRENIASSGWATLGGILSIRPDEELDLDELTADLDRIESTIHEQPNRVRYTMNGFVISVGGYVASLTKTAEKKARRIGEVEVDMGGTACKVPFAPDYIQKMRDRGVIGKKRRSARC